MKKIIIFLIIFLSFNLYANNDKVKFQEVLTGDQVFKMLEAAYKSSKENNFNVTITIVDKSGKILGTIRNEDAGVYTLSASFKKAYTAASQKRTTLEIMEGIKKGVIPDDIKFLDDNFTVMEGGLPIFINGKVVGGIGVGGAHSSQDTKIAKVALDVLEKIIK